MGCLHLLNSIVFFLLIKQFLIALNNTFVLLLVNSTLYRPVEKQLVQHAFAVVHIVQLANDKYLVGFDILENFFIQLASISTHNQNVRTVRGNQRFVSRNICSEGPNHPSYSDLIAVKTRAVFWRNISSDFRNKGSV